ncbi:DsbA family protein [Corynebacterium auriscanis]|uniref:DsbA family protein n=1 Tax=Corynebacterium auriscanis TaxID=99807 RepID=UPI003CEB6B3A
MSQQIKAPNSRGGSGFIWVIVAILAIAAVVIGLFVWKQSTKNTIAEDMPQDDVNFTVSAKDGGVTLASDKVKKDAPTVEIFSDFSCPHCADLFEADHNDVKKAVSDGDVKVVYRFLNILDQKPGGSSTRGGAVAYAIAETGNAKAFWNIHQKMFKDQPEVARTWNWEEMGKAAEAYDVDPALVEKIKKGEVQDDVLPFFESNAKILTDRGAQVSTPQVFANGKPYELKSDGGQKPQSWVPDLVWNKDPYNGEKK